MSRIHIRSFWFMTMFLGAVCVQLAWSAPPSATITPTQTHTAQDIAGHAEGEVTVAQEDGPDSIAAVGTLEDMERFHRANPNPPVFIKPYYETPAPRAIPGGKFGRRPLAQPTPGDDGTPDGPVHAPIPSELFAPPLGANWAGMQDPNTTIPPDTTGAVGPGIGAAGRVFEFLNTGRTIYDKNGAITNAAISLQAFWSSLGTAAGQPANSLSDPRVLWDHYTNRWLVSALGFGTNRWLLVGVSQTADPAGAYLLYAIRFNVNTNGFSHSAHLLDFDNMGFDPNNVIITGNTFPNAGGNPIHPDVYVINKQRLIAGPAGQTLVNNVDFRIFHNPCPTFGASFSFAPCITYGQNPGNAVNYILDTGWYDSAALGDRFFRVTPITGIGAAATMDCQGDNNFIRTTGCYNFNVALAGQPSACTAIDTGSYNIRTNGVVRNGHIWLTHAAGAPVAGCPDPASAPAATKPDVWWYEVNPAVLPDPLGPPPVQQGAVTDPNQAYYYPSISVNRDDCAMLGFTGSGPNAGQFASGLYTARQVCDPANTMQAVNTLKAGVDTYLKTFGTGRNRWGDYSATCVDPHDDATMWTVQEYANPEVGGNCVDGAGRWGTWWGSIQCPTTPCIPAGQDCWTTECGQTVYEFKNTPIPCSFFDPGSEPFDGAVRLGGGDPGDIDTRVQRNADINFTNPLPNTQNVPIEIISLNLVSCAPITVRYCNGAPPQDWTVSVVLSTSIPPPPPGTMSVTKTHANGGYFSSQFFVQPSFTFTRVSDNAVRVLDTGAEAIPPMLLNSTSPAPWVHQATISIGPTICGVNFVPGVQEGGQPATPGSTCTSTVQCCKPVGHGGGGHLHVTGHICTPCPCGACCDPATGACTEISAANPGATCAAMFGGTGQYKGDSSSCASSDGDSIPDSYETNDCCSGSTCQTGSLCSHPTDPTRADTDGDGLNDDVDPFPCNRCLPLAAPNRPAICDQFDVTLPGDGDCDDNGTCDLCEIQRGLQHDCNNNGIPDNCEPDCNSNGTPDDYDITCGTSLDANQNGIPDECETVCPTCLGDINGDSLLDGRDIRCFILCLLYGGAPGCNCACADMDGSGTVTTADVDPFVTAILAKPSVCPVLIEVAAPVVGAGPGRLNFNVSVGLGGPFNNAVADGEGSLQLNQGPPSFFDVFWYSDGNPGQNVPAFTVQIPGTTPIQDNGPSGTSWTLNGTVDVVDGGGIEPDADVHVSLLGPPLAQLGDAGARYSLDPLPSSFAVVRDPNAFGGLPPGTVIPITQHPVKIKKYCVYLVVDTYPLPPIDCPAGWAVGAILCVECDARQKQQCPPLGYYRVVGRYCFLDLDPWPPQTSTCKACPPGSVDNAKFVDWENFPK